MGLPIAKLGYQRQDRRSILLPTRQALQNHAGVLRQRAGEAVAREELRLIAVVWERGPGYQPLIGNGELIRTDGRPFLWEVKTLYQVPS